MTFMFIIILGEGTRVTLEDDGEKLSNIRGWTIMDNLPKYEDVVEFLKFIHNYVVPIYGKKDMTKWLQTHPSDTLCTRISESSIAYAVLVYESRYKVWLERIEIRNKSMTKEEKIIHKRNACPEYHTPVGTKLKLYEVGWTPEGREYYNELIHTFKFLKDNKQYWNNMNNHWMEYEDEVLGRGKIVGDKNKNEKVLGIEDYPEDQFMVDFRGEI